MKKLFTIIAAILLTAIVFAQAPQKISYQAVVRDGSNNLVTSHAVGMQISIFQGSASGTAVYTETQTPTTNANGLVSIEIGSGAGFSTIDWSAGPYFIKTETDPTGGASYTITGTSQLLSVPYALHAKTAESITGTITETDPTFTAWDKDYSDLTNTPTTITTAQASAITVNTAKVGVTNGTVAGQMQYWNGSAWVIVAATVNEGATLQMIGGVPTWTGGTPPPPPLSVTNPATGKIWMDRNLGASQVATSSTDANSYGHLYQWGRGNDGHQVRTSGTTTTKSSSDTPGHGDFILITKDPYDWRSPQNTNLWQGVGGTNNPCPSGYRLPTEAEFNAERLSWTTDNAAGAFASPLKLPMAGWRYDRDGSFKIGCGYYWSSTVSVFESQSRFLWFSSSPSIQGFSAEILSYYRGAGFSVRCVKD